MLAVRQGSTRMVIVVGPVAIKLPRDPRGRKGNLAEADLWRRYRAHPLRGPLLCPVLWCDRAGRVLLMRAARPLPAGEETPDAEWDYQPGGDDPGFPSEGKRSDWGILDGRPVLVDYAVHALAE